MCVHSCVCVCVCVLRQLADSSLGASYREDEAVLEVGELFVALLTAEEPVLLVHHLLVAVLAGARLVQTVLLTQVYYGGDAAEIVSLGARGWWGGGA